MERFVELLVSGLLKNLRNPKLYIALTAIVVTCLLVFPYIDANFLAHRRIEHRIDILNSLAVLDKERIESDPVLQQEYSSILDEVNRQRDYSFYAVMKALQHPAVEASPRGKIISGGLLSWLLLLCIPFIKIDGKGGKLIAVVVIAALSVGLAYVGYLLPTLLSPWVNYIGYPVLQLLGFISLVSKPNKNSDDSNK